jgi:DNA-binding NtrC family response regulator
MLKEPVALQIVRGTLEAIVASQSAWKTNEDVWQAFRKWSAGRGREAALSWEEKPPYFHELQDLYEFGFEHCRSLDSDRFLRLSGRCFADIILRERLHDLVALCLGPGGEVPAAIAALFERFMEQYSRDLYRVQTRCLPTEVTFTVCYSEPEAIARHLQAFGKDPLDSFVRSFRVIVATVEVGMEYLLDPWKSEWLTFETSTGIARLKIPPGTKLNYKKQVETLTRFAHQLEHRHAEDLLARDLEHDMILQSPFMRDKWEKIKLASATDELILLRGEPGTGKTYLAERIHEMSARKGRPFVEVGLTADVGVDNLVQSHLFGHVKGAFTSAYEDKQGLFALSDSGTIFLDEIGDATPDLQAKLLRVIEKKTFKPLGSTKDVTVDVRIIAATNKDLEAMSREGRFREDLYHRLNVIQIEMPPLRDRPGEIPLLARHFLRRIALDAKRSAKPLSAEAAKFAASYAWPGNIREFLHVLKYALLFSQGSEVALKDFPEHVFKARPQSRRTAPPAAGADPREDVIDVERLSDLLARSDSIPLDRNRTSDVPWHIDYARKTYLRALIRHFRGNLRKITPYWDCDSEKTLRAAIRDLGLWEELEQVRGER